jgi:uncharacterized membrane protein
MTKRNKIIYWSATGFLAFGMLAQGFSQILLTQGYVDMVIVRLGYPLYFLYIIGAWKILGVVAILVPRYRVLNEWAYAGFFFVMSGAAFSHIAMGDPLSELFPAVFLLLVIAVSWYFRPAVRQVIPAINTQEG